MIKIELLTAENCLRKERKKQRLCIFLHVHQRRQ